MTHPYPTPTPTRRDWLRQAGAGLAGGMAAALTGCSRPESAARPSATDLDRLLDDTVRRLAGGWVDTSSAWGHAWRDGKLDRAPPRADAGAVRRVTVAVVGAGIAGLNAARCLVEAGIDDLVVFDLEDAAGGHARGHRLGGQPCPLGAHYLPVPDPGNLPLLAWLHGIGLARTEHGRVRFDERHLCHAPQERLFQPAAGSTAGHWQDGLLPASDDTALQAQHRHLAAQIRRLAAEAGFGLPTSRVRWSAGHAALDAQSFAHWLEAEGCTAAPLRWYLDYCCRDDFGVGTGGVSAWAGLHYFASRHGLPPLPATGGGTDAPGAGLDDDVDPAHEALFTWPEGNAWLVQRLADGLGGRLLPAHGVTRVRSGRHDLSLEVWNARSARPERWVARQVVLALPLFAAARLLDRPPPALTALRPRLDYAPWLVSNLLLDRNLFDRPGAPPAWDNVIYGSSALGYVDARHQSLRPDAAHGLPPVLTHYWALGDELPHTRAALLHEDWRVWARRVVADLAAAHPDLPAQLRQMDLMRWGHGMLIPRPGLRGHPALQALQPTAAAIGQAARLTFAHADLSGYSVFEEAFHWGHEAARLVAHRLGRTLPT